MTGSQVHLCSSTPAGIVRRRREDGSSFPGFTWFLENRYTNQMDDADEETRQLAFGSIIPPSTDLQVNRTLHARISQLLPGQSCAVEQVQLSDLQSDPWMERLGRLRADIAKLPVQRLEFLARRLSKYVVARVDGSHVEVIRQMVLASPIYVAIAE
jgi:hypothetical protein